MRNCLKLLLDFLASKFKPKARLKAKIIVLRHQLNVLRRILKSYASYYNEARTHLSLGKDASLDRSIQRLGAFAVLSSLAASSIDIVETDFRQAQEFIFSTGVQ